jgi:hypothetical protein
LFSTNSAHASPALAVERMQISDQCLSWHLCNGSPLHHVELVLLRIESKQGLGPLLFPLLLIDLVHQIRINLMHITEKLKLEFLYLIPVIFFACNIATGISYSLYKIWNKTEFRDQVLKDPKIKWNSPVLF